MIKFLKSLNWQHKIYHILIGIFIEIIFLLFHQPINGLWFCFGLIIGKEAMDHIAGKEVWYSNLFDILITFGPSLLTYLIYIKI